ncbi:MAG: NapC/NirT family cytochrome c [Elusimicrobiota bacterium]
MKRLVSPFSRAMVSLGIVAAVFPLAAYTSVELTSTPWFCGSCHEMEPVKEGWMASEHYPRPDRPKGRRGASCRDCHLPGWHHPASVLAQKIRHGLKDGYRHFLPARDHEAKDFYFALKQVYLSQTTDAMCLRCHATVRDPAEDVIETGLGEIRGLHSSKEATVLRCVTCHKNMGHGIYE